MKPHVHIATYEAKDLCLTGTTHNTTNSVYVWDRATGALSKILEGAKDPMEDCDWHPTRPVIVTVSDQGMILVWVTPATEHWAAYAPGFEELEENLEYMEREDEFDVVDARELDRRQMEQQQEVHVDVFGMDAKVTATNLEAGGITQDGIEVDETDDALDFQPTHDEELHYDGMPASEATPRQETPANVLMVRSHSDTAANGRSKMAPSDEQVARELQASLNGRTSRSRRK